MAMKSSSRGRSSTQGTASFAKQSVWIGSAIVALIVTTVAFLQPPHEDGLEHRLGPLDVLLHPIQRNAFAYRPVITQNLRAIHTKPGTPLVWAVGDGNLVIRSTDAGDHWQQIVLDTSIASLTAQDQTARPEQRELQLLRDSIERMQAELDSLVAERKRLESQPQQSRDPKQQVDPKMQMQQKAPDPGYQTNVQANVPSRQELASSQRLQRLRTRADSLARLLGSPVAQPRVVNLHDVSFTDAATGWIVGDHGTLLASTDSGTTWQRRPPLPAQRLAAVRFRDAQTGLIIAPDNGLVFTTSDGGESWIPQRVANGDSLRAAGLLGDSLLWGEFDEGRAYLSRDGGRTWQQGRVPFSGADNQSYSQADLWWVPFSGTRADTTPPNFVREIDSMADAPNPSGDSIRAFHSVDRSNAWAVGDGVYRIRDKGRTIDRVVGRNKLSAIHFFDIDKGLAAAGNGRLLRTSNGGRTWKTVRTGSLDDFVHLIFADERNGYARLHNGRVWETSNAGRSWREKRGGYGLNLQGADPTLTACLQQAPFGNAGEIACALRADSAARLTFTLGSTLPPLRSLTTFADSLAIAVFVQDGSLQHLRRRNGEWSLTATSYAGPLRSASFSDSRVGLGVNAIGELLATTDGGASWFHPPSSASNLASVSMIGRDSAYVLTADGALYYFEPETAINWTPVITESTASSVWPAPWYYAAMLLLVIIAMILSRGGTAVVQSAIEGVFVSDRPLEPGDRDDLGIKPIANAVSRFLRNTRTIPPLTLAINGKWGSGKSSMLNLVRGDLLRHGLRPVWFNAWHHQKEDNLLAALLETIRKDAIPSIWSWSGLAFRTRLVFIRARRYWFAVLILLALAVIFWRPLLSETDHTLGFADLLNGIKLLAARMAEFASQTQGSPTPEGAPIDAGHLRNSVGVLLGSLLALRAGYSKLIKAFGVNPALLLSSSSGSASKKDLAAQTGFRHTFAVEFREVTRALGKYRLVIMVDDLDRCRPSNVLDVLEAINFLVSSGECFVLLGIDRDQVVTYVGMAFKDAAKELAEQHKTRPDSPLANKDEAAVRWWYAQEYLEKLINLDIAVPVATAEQLSDVMAPEPAEAPAPQLDIRERLKLRRRQLMAAAIIVVALTSGGFVARVSGVWGGARSATPPPAPENPVAERDATTPPATTPTPAPDTTQLNQPSPSALIANVAPARLIPEVIGDRRPSAVGIALTLLAGLLVWHFLRRPPPEVRDSNEFLAALRCWSPLVYSRRRTPRSAKKFLNRVRYYAMLQRPEDPEIRRIDNIASWVNQNILSKIPGLERTGDHNVVPLQTGPAAAIPDPLLVALGAIYDANPAWLNENAFWQEPITFIAAQPKSPIDDEQKKTLAAAGSIEGYREGFKKMLSETR